MAKPPGGTPTVNAAKALMKKMGQLNERSLAGEFAREFETRWRYNADEGYWLQWVGTHWARNQTLQFLDAAGHYVAQLAQLFRRLDDITKTEAVRFQGQRAVASIEKICRGLPMFMARNVLFDSDPFLLGTPGGTVDLRTGELFLADPEDFITVLAPVTPAPEGTPLGPQFKAFLAAITGNDEDFEKTLQQWAGISATGSSRDQRILFLYGSGGNGKGVFLRTLAGLLGDYAVNAPRDMLMLEKYSQHATHLVDVLRARMALATEVDDDATWDTALVKDITGGDAMSVNRMRQDPFRLLARCSVTISGNKKPALKGIDEAVRRRFLVATFVLRLTPDMVKTDLEQVFIRDEGPAIMRWIIDGAVQRENEGKLHVAKVISEDTADYFAEEDVLGDFIAQYMEPVSEALDPPQKVRTSDVFATWKAFCRASGRSFGAQNSFTTAMKAAGVMYARTMDGRYFLHYNLRLTPKDLD